MYSREILFAFADSEISTSTSRSRFIANLINTLLARYQCLVKV